MLGASRVSLYLLFIRTYPYQTLLATVVILPLVHILLNGWLEDFAYRVQVSWWISPLSVLFLIVMILTSVSFQVIRAAQVNPIRLLRQE